MPDSREGRGVARPWRRRLLALAAAPLALSVMGAAAPSPDASPSPSPMPSPTPAGVLQITKTDPSGQAIPVAGVTFEVREAPLVGTPPPGQPIQVKTKGDGTAVALGLDVGHRYCVKELTAPAGYQLAPTYTPMNGCTFASGTILAADPPSATPTPTPTDTPSPTPSPTPPTTGELQITKTDPGNKTITVPGFTFNIHVGSSGGQVIATISTDGTGMAVAGALNPAMYCVEEISAPDGYQVAPTYSPAACVNVASDSTQGHAPTIVTVIDPPASTPTPPADADAGAAATPSPSATPHAAQAVVTQPPSSPAAALARGLVAVGALLLLVGAVMIVVAVRRRRRPPTEAPPSDYWYDSTIT